MEPKKKEAILNLLFLLSIVAAIILLNKYFLTEKPLEYCLSYNNASDCAAVFTPDPALKVQDGLCYYNCTTNELITCQNRSVTCKWTLDVKEE